MMTSNVSWKGPVSPVFFGAQQQEGPKVPDQEIPEEIGYGQAPALDHRVEARIPKGFHMKIHDSTREEHKILRANSFLNQLITGKMVFCSKAYVAYLCNLFVLHVAMEKAQAKIVEEYGRGFFVFPVLFRSEALQNDIQMWSMFNSFSEKFADLDPSSEEYLDAIQSVAEPSTKEFAASLEGSSIAVIGTLYVLYGTLMAGGQQVKQGIDGQGGVMSGFIDRISEMEEEGTPSAKEVKIRAEIAKDPSFLGVYAKKSVSFFSFPDGFSIPEFKRTWHQNLDEVPSKLSEDAREKTLNQIIHQAKQTMVLVDAFLHSMLTNLT